MYIKPQKFKDEENLLEQLFDFSLGQASEEILALKQEIEKELQEHAAFQEYRASLTDEEDIMELDEEERLIRLAERLMAIYESFEVADNELLGIKKEHKTSLYSMQQYSK